MARELLLGGPQNVTIITREEVVVQTDKISIDLIWDDGSSVVVKISFFNPSGVTKEMVLWSGDDYINIGQWTDNDIDNRIKQLLNLS
jgi:hypothetical protein